MLNNSKGKTRNLFFYKIGLSGVVLVDAPGYGYAKGNTKELESWGKMILKYITHGRNLYRIVCLVDAEHGLKQLDTMLFELCESKQKPFLIALTKCDKISETKLGKLYDEISEKAKSYKFCSPIINATSSR